MQNQLKKGLAKERKSRYQNHLVVNLDQSIYTYSQYLQKTFGGKTYKVVVASGLTCPTRDGTIMKAGCAFCDVRGSSSFHGKKGRGLEVKEQLQNRMEPIQKRFQAEKFLAYFQSYTNTYSDIQYLREIYSAALTTEGISGLCIGTRPDCIPDQVLLLLEEFAQKNYVSLELGVQSFCNKTLDWLERGHDQACSVDAFQRVKKLAPSIHTCAHLMFGMPTEPENIAEISAQFINESKIEGVKLHQLMVLENTKLAERYRQNSFELISIENYAKLISKFVENLDPAIYIERLYANATHPEECLGPKWSTERWASHNFIRDYFAQNKVQQGKFFKTQA